MLCSLLPHNFFAKVTFLGGSGQVLLICTGMNKTLPLSTSLPVMDEIAGVNTASLGGYLHGSKKKGQMGGRVPR